MLAFRQVNVFSPLPMLGNPVAVVHDADGVTDEQMAAFARWTNLSETTFLLEPTMPKADYRLRIFTPGGELPFAGHPTLGSAHAWLEAGGVPQRGTVVVQQCGAGLVEVRRGERLAFAGPPLVHSGPVDDADLGRAVAILGIGRADVVDAAWVDNGPGWLGILLRDAEAVLALRPRPGDLEIGVIGPHSPGGEIDVEVRAFCAGLGIAEDPVTGSLNAGFAEWLAGPSGAGVLPASYVAAQGTVLQRRGRVHVAIEDGVVWVGGRSRPVIVGEIEL